MRRFFLNFFWDINSHSFSPSRWKVLILILIVLGFFSTIILTYSFFSSKSASYVTAIFSGAIYLITTDIIFRALVRYKTGRPYQMIPKLPFKEMYVEPHPYLTFTFKKNFIIQKPDPPPFPLNRDKGYSIEQSKINNLGFIDGYEGARDMVIPKPKDLFRIICLGASTTTNRLIQDGKVHSYPIHLEEILRRRFPDKNIEVNNAGLGGYTTTEILITFLLKLFDAKPDLMILYQGYNDLGPSLTDNFQSDYSHARKGLGETYYRYKRASIIPYIPVAFINFFTNLFYPQNSRYTLIPSISQGKANIKNDFKGLETYSRNIKHIINICKCNDIHMVLSTFCHHLYQHIQKDPVHLKYREGVSQENEVMRQLAKENSLPLVDNSLLIPADDKYFVDSVHFSPEGMKKLAENFSKPIIDFILDQNHHS